MQGHKKSDFFPQIIYCSEPRVLRLAKFRKEAPSKKEVWQASANISIGSRINPVRTHISVRPHRFPDLGSPYAIYRVAFLSLSLLRQDRYWILDMKCCSYGNERFRTQHRILSVNLEIAYIFVIVSLRDEIGVRCDRPKLASWRRQFLPRPKPLHSRFCIKRLGTTSLLPSVLLSVHRKSPFISQLLNPAFPTMPPSSSTCQFHLPDLFTHCTLKASTNPYYKEAATESRAWINSYGIFTDRKRTFFIQGQNELLCSHVYQYAGYEQFRTTSDFVRFSYQVF